MTRVFVQIGCVPATAYKVADNICLREFQLVSHFTRDPFNLVLKKYIPEDQDIGK